MKKTFVIALALGLCIGATSFAWGADECDTIKEGEVTYLLDRYLEGEVVPLGYDIYGYNYHAHMFNGLYCNVYLNGFLDFA